MANFYPPMTNKMFWLWLIRTFLLYKMVSNIWIIADTYVPKEDKLAEGFIFFPPRQIPIKI